MPLRSMAIMSQMNDANTEDFRKMIQEKGIMSKMHLGQYVYTATKVFQISVVMAQQFPKS